MSLTLSQPRTLGASLARVFFGIGLAMPVATGVLSIAFLPLGLMSRAEVYPWDEVLSVVYLLAVFLTPESICVYLFQKGVIKSFFARMGFFVVVVFLYANYIFLSPAVYTVLPVAFGTLMWALWPPIAALTIGLLVGKIEAKQVFT